MVLVILEWIVPYCCDILRGYDSVTQKMVLDATLPNTHHYKVRIKGKEKQSMERCSSY